MFAYFVCDGFSGLSLGCDVGVFFKASFLCEGGWVLGTYGVEFCFEVFDFGF